MTTAVFVEATGLRERGLTIPIAIMIVTIVKVFLFPSINGDVTAFTGYGQQNIDDGTVEGDQLT